MNFSIKCAPVVQFLPQIKQHHVVVVKDNSKDRPIYAIDFSPLTTPNENIKLLLNRNIPAEIRIRNMEYWSLFDWYDCPTISVSEIKNEDVRAVVKDALDNWKDYSKQKLSSDGCVMNLYQLNCQHFSYFFVNKIGKIYGFDNNNVDSSLT